MHILELKKKKLKLDGLRLGMVVHACNSSTINPSTWEAEAGGLRV
jgi:hypothetical protein